MLSNLQCNTSPAPPQLSPTRRNNTRITSIHLASRCIAWSKSPESYRKRIRIPSRTRCALLTLPDPSASSYPEKFITNKLFYLNNPNYNLTSIPLPLVT